MKYLQSPNRTNAYGLYGDEVGPGHLIAIIEFEPSADGEKLIRLIAAAPLMMTETMWKIIVFMYRTLKDDETPYWSAWHLEERLGVKLAGCGVPDGDSAIEKLVQMGLIEELPDLGCRYRIVVKGGE